MGRNCSGQVLDEDLINKLCQLFNDAEKSALLFIRGEISFDVNIQLKIHYGGYLLTYDREETFNRFSMQLEHNSQLLKKIIVAKNYQNDLFNPENSFETNTSERSSKSDQSFEANDHLLTTGKAKNLDFDRTDRISTDSMISDGRTGNAERSDDYSIESIWDKKQKNISVKETLGNSKQLKQIILSEDFDLEKLKIEDLEAPTTEAAPESQPQQDDLPMDNMAITKSAMSSIDEDTTQVTQLNTSESKGEREGSKTGVSEKINTGKEIRKKFVLSDAVIKSINETDIPDLRERFWLSFANLFCPPYC